MEDFSSTVEHLELPRQHVHFDRNRKRAKPCKKGRESLIWFCSHFQFQERVLFAPFWSSKCSNRPCSGFLALQGSLKCHGIAVKDDDDGGGPATKVPRESIDDNPTRRYTRSSSPALDLKKCLLCDSKKKNEKVLKPRGTYPLYLGVFPNDSALHCSNMSPWTRLFTPIFPRRSLYISFYWPSGHPCKIYTGKKKKINNARILMRKDDVCSWRSTSWQTFMRRNVPCLFLRTESTPAPSPSTPLPLPTRRMPKVILIIQRLSPMTATMQTWPSNVLPEPQWSSSGSPMLIVLWVY